MKINWNEKIKELIEKCKKGEYNDVLYDVQEYIDDPSIEMKVKDLLLAIQNKCIKFLKYDEEEKTIKSSSQRILLSKIFNSDFSKINYVILDNYLEKYENENKLMNIENAFFSNYLENSEVWNTDKLNLINKICQYNKILDAGFYNKDLKKFTTIQFKDYLTKSKYFIYFNKVESILIKNKLDIGNINFIFGFFKNYYLCFTPNISPEHLANIMSNKIARLPKTDIYGQVDKSAIKIIKEIYADINKESLD